MAQLAGRLVLNDDVMLIPVGELADDARAQVECGADDVAVSRMGGRAGSKIVDADAASLLAQFREPRSAVEAVILFARERSLEPDSVLESAYPMLRSMVDGGVLVQAQADGEPKPPATLVTAGDAVLGSVVTRMLQVLEDTEVYLLTGPAGRRSVLKVERRVPGAGASVRARLEREADLLAHINHGIAPKLFGRGSIDGQAYLEIEFVPGVDAVTASVEWRERKDAIGHRALLSLAATIAATYANLHGQGVLHGDVHPRNVLIGADGSARLIDFGLARSMAADTSLPSEAERGGIPFFFEPELARAYLEGIPPMPSTPEGEQYSVAALIYLLMTGTHWQDFRLDRQGMFQDILERPVLSFAERGVASWLALESVLARALSKDVGDRFPSMAEFADAISRLSAELGAHPAASPQTSLRLEQLLGRTKARVAIDGPWMTGEPPSAPFASLTYGSSGIALGLLCIAQREGDALGLATADVWACRSAREIDRDGAFYNPDIEITPETVGQGSPYHSPSGIHATAALIARAAADIPAQMEATSDFLKAAGRPLVGLDLTLGTASTILASAILLDAASGLPGDWTPLRELGNVGAADLWQALDSKPPIRDADIDYLGIAHGWAGFLYATLQWSRISGSPLPGGVTQRLEELSALAMPAGRGVEWPWVLRVSGDPPTMAGWCNGSSGQVFLWSLAHELLGDPRWLAMAEGAAWNSWESADPAASLCCGLVGRAYALLNFFRHTDDSLWLDRARALGNRAATNGGMPPEYPHSLFKGEFGLAVLAADLEVPHQAVMPFFEPFGYGASTRCV
jgi:serine/threonine-protein kinase